MPGKGALSKDPANRARRNKDLTPKSIINFAPAKAPKLPPLPSGKWNSRTLVWYAKWRNSPQSAVFMATDWEFLLETALLHHNFWNGDLSLAAELRLRSSKFGATVEDRARLRMVYAEATTAEVKAAKAVLTSKDRYAGLHAVESIDNAV